MLPTRAYLVRSARKNAWLLYFAASLPIGIACGSVEDTASLPPDLSGFGGDPGSAGGGSSVSGAPARGLNDTSGGAAGTTPSGTTTSAGGRSAGTSGSPGSSESSGGYLGLGGSSSTGARQNSAGAAGNGGRGFGGRQNTGGADGNGGRGTGGRRGSGGSSGTGAGGESQSGGAPGSDGGGSGCSDGVKDGQETDVDCGGPACSPCDDGKKCVQDRDCVSNNCATTLTGHVCRVEN